MEVDGVSRRGVWQAVFSRLRASSCAVGLVLYYANQTSPQLISSTSAPSIYLRRSCYFNI